MISFPQVQKHARKKPAAKYFHMVEKKRPEFVLAADKNLKVGGEGVGGAGGTNR